jgi:hypothetical protein
LRRIASTLRAIGYTVDFTTEGKNRDRLIHIAYKGASPSAADVAETDGASANQKEEDLIRRPCQQRPTL